MEAYRKNSLTLVGGVLLIAFGVLALVAQLTGGLGFWGTIWPLIIVGLGGIFFALMLAGGPALAPLAVPGSILAGIGLLMFFQNLTDHWESWAYGWTVILMSVGVGLFIMGSWAGRESQRQAGLRVLKIGVAMFVVFGAFFEMIFNSAGIARLVFPALLILLGGYLLFTRFGLFPGQKREDVPPTE